MACGSRDLDWRLMFFIILSGYLRHFGEEKWLTSAQSLLKTLCPMDQSTVMTSSSNCLRSAIVKSEFWYARKDVDRLNHKLRSLERELGVSIAFDNDGNDAKVTLRGPEAHVTTAVLVTSALLNHSTPGCDVFELVKHAQTNQLMRRRYADLGPGQNVVGVSLDEFRAPKDFARGWSPRSAAESNLVSSSTNGLDELADTGAAFDLLVPATSDIKPEVNVPLRTSPDLLDIKMELDIKTENGLAVPMSSAVATPKPPLRFHHICGENVVLSNDNKSAKRNESFCKAVCFSDRPIDLGEVVRIKLAQVQVVPEGTKGWNGVLRLGVTNLRPEDLADAMPRYATPDLVRDKPGTTWIDSIKDSFVRENAVVKFWVTSEGRLTYAMDGHANVVGLKAKTAKPLFLLIDVYGKTQAIEFVDEVTENNEVNGNLSKATPLPNAPFAALDAAVASISQAIKPLASPNATVPLAPNPTGAVVSSVATTAFSDAPLAQKPAACEPWGVTCAKSLLASAPPGPGNVISVAWPSPANKATSVVAPSTASTTSFTFGSISNTTPVVSATTSATSIVPFGSILSSLPALAPYASSSGAFPATAPRPAVVSTTSADAPAMPKPTSVFGTSSGPAISFRLREPGAATVAKATAPSVSANCGVAAVLGNIFAARLAAPRAFLPSSIPTTTVQASTSASSKGTSMATIAKSTAPSVSSNSGASAVFGNITSVLRAAFLPSVTPTTSANLVRGSSPQAQTRRSTDRNAAAALILSPPPPPPRRLRRSTKSPSPRRRSKSPSRRRRSTKSPSRRRTSKSPRRERSAKSPPLRRKSKRSSRSRQRTPQRSNAPSTSACASKSHTKSPKKDRNYRRRGSRDTDDSSGEKSMAVQPFLEAPFFEIVEVLLPPTPLPRWKDEHGRVQATAIFTLTNEQLKHLRDHKTSNYDLHFRMALPEHSLRKAKDHFPGNVQIAVNGHLVPLPNVYTPPAGDHKIIDKRVGLPVSLLGKSDLTQSAQELNVSGTYDDEDNWAFSVHLVKRRSLQSRLRDFTNRQRIFSSRQFMKLVKNNLKGDAEIACASTSLRVSLNCPLTQQRIGIPARGTACTHLPCFDLEGFLKMIYMKPTLPWQAWNCPVCFKPALFDDLQRDEYMTEVLETTTADVTHIEIQPDGAWQAGGKTRSHSGDTANSNRRSAVFDVVDVTDDDDEVDDYRDTPPINVISEQGLIAKLKKRQRELSSLASDDEVIVVSSSSSSCAKSPDSLPDDPGPCNSKRRKKSSAESSVSAESNGATRATIAPSTSTAAAGASAAAKLHRFNSPPSKIPSSSSSAIPIAPLRFPTTSSAVGNDANHHTFGSQSGLSAATSANSVGLTGKTAAGRTPSGSRWEVEASTQFLDNYDPLPRPSASYDSQQLFPPGLYASPGNQQSLSEPVNSYSAPPVTYGIPNQPMASFQGQVQPTSASAIAGGQQGSGVCWPANMNTRRSEPIASSSGVSMNQVDAQSYAQQQQAPPPFVPPWCLGAPTYYYTPPWPNVMPTSYYTPPWP